MHPYAFAAKEVIHSHLTVTNEGRNGHIFWMDVELDGHSFHLDIYPGNERVEIFINKDTEREVIKGDVTTFKLLCRLQALIQKKPRK